MVKRMIIRKVIPFVLVLAIPATPVFAQEELPEEIRQEEAQREIEVGQEFTYTYGEEFALDAKLVEVSGGKGQAEAEECQTEAQEQKTEAQEQKAEAQEQQMGAQEQQAEAQEQQIEAQEQKAEAQEQQIGAQEQQTATEDATAAGEMREEKASSDIVSDGILQYQSEDSKIAALKLDEAGEVKVEAVGVGDTKITITAPETDEYKELQTKVDIHVTEAEQIPLEDGTFAKVENVKGGISITWNKIDNAQGYYLYRSTTGKSPWSKIKIAESADDVSYVDKQVTAGKTYYYRVKGFADSEKVVGSAGETEKIVYLEAPSLGVSLSASGNQLQWNRVAGTGGYYVYRREPSQKEWTIVSTIKEPGEIAWCDTSAGNAKTYVYTVRAYKGESMSPYAAEKSYVRVTAPSVKKWKRKTSTKYTLSWNVNSSATGYQIQYAQNSMFIGAKTATVKKAKTSSYTVSKLAKKKTYYARIRAYKVVGTKTYYSAWSASPNTKSTRTVKATMLTKKKKPFEICSWAKQKLYQYDTLQGSCTDGTYAYYLLNYSKISKCKIVKVKRSNLKVVKVSGALDVGHGNDMTYDSGKRRLVIVHSTGNDPKALTSVDPGTLKVIESKHITIPNKLAGGTTTDAKNATAFTGLAYSSGRKQYAVLLSHNYNFVVLDANLNPVRYIKVNKKNNYTMQGIDATDDYILVAQSPKTSKQKYNIITVYDWNGNYISKINVKKGYEIESVYHVGSKYYAGFYRSYYKTYYKTVVKQVKVNGKTKKKKVKVKCRQFQRANYVYQLSGL